MNYLGIDSGMSKSKPGAMALIGSDCKLIGLEDWQGGPEMAELLKYWQTLYTIDFAALEKIWARPNQNVKSTTSQLTNYGWWLGALDMLCISTMLVAPATWMAKQVGKKANNNDKPSLPVARRLFPTAELHLKKHDGRSDALLIANWARLNY